MSQSIRDLRQAKKLQQKQLAAMAGVSLRELSKAERGLELPGSAFFTSIAGVLGVGPDVLRKTHEEIVARVIVGEGYTTAIPDGSFVLPRRTEPDNNKRYILDLFCGTGGFSHGFAMTGEFEVIAGLDLLPDRIKTFSANHPTATAICADINAIEKDMLADTDYQPDVIIGGPPCQGFSSIRPFRSLTESDIRNNLFEQFALVVAAFRPAWFVLENVVGLLTHKNGTTLTTMLNLFREVGYNTDWRILNAAEYGLPQRRERLVVVGSRDGKTFAWPEPTHHVDAALRSMAGKNGTIHQMSLFAEYRTLPAISVMDAIGDLPQLEAGEKADHYRSNIDMTDYQRLMRGKLQTLTLHEATAHTSHMLEIIHHAGYCRADLPEGLTTSGFSSSYSRLEPDIPSVTLTVNFVHPASNKCIHPYQNRALTPREGARLQGFEDSYQFIGTRSQIVKQIGNAVPPILGKIIADALLAQF